MAVTQAGQRCKRFGAAGDAITGNQIVRYFRWISGSAGVSGDELVVSDAAGNVWYRSVADGPNFPDVFPIFDVLDGITVTTMDSGELFVYIS